MWAVLVITCMREVEVFVEGVGDSLYEGGGGACGRC